MNTSGHASPLIDLQGLHLLRLVARCRGVTPAAKLAGLTQSAMTRQIQNMESRLGVTLFERTTRRLALTPAGELLLRETEALPLILDGALRRMREDFMGVRREIRIGVARSVAVAHLPGLLHAQRRKEPEVHLTIAHLPGNVLVEAVADGRLDAAVLCPPRRLPRQVVITHRMTDVFTLITAREGDVFKAPPPREWLEAQAWLSPPPETQTRRRMEEWWRAQDWNIRPATETDSFDLMIQLAALGLGIALVPRRALSGFPRKRQVRRIPLAAPFSRELAVIIPKRSSPPPHVVRFVGNILFS